MPGLIGTGQSYQEQSAETLRQAQFREEKLESENQQLEAAESAQSSQLIGTGAAAGFAAGAGSAALGASYGVWAGPIGLVAGAAAGYLIGELF